MGTLKKYGRDIIASDTARPDPTGQQQSEEADVTKYAKGN
jgi:hypothetical protein